MPISSNEIDENIGEKTQFTCEGATKNDLNAKETNIFLRQLWAFSGVFLLMILSGTVSGYSAILLPQLEYENSTMKATTSQESWIASMAPLPMAIGCLISGWSMEQFGRQRTLKVCTVIFFIGWIIVYMSRNIEILLFGRFVTGFCGGYLGPAGSCYIGEVSKPKYRGIFLAGICLGVAIGLMVTHILGTFLDWPTVALIIALCPIIVAIITAPVPESHVWLLNQGRVDDAQDAFAWYSGKSAILEVKESALTDQSFDWRKLLKRDFVKPVLIMNLFFITAQLSGNNAVVFYSVGIMQKTVPSLNKYAAMIIVDVIRVIMSIVACILTKKYKTRALTFISAVGTIISLYSLALFAYLSDEYPNDKVYTTVPLVFLISYIISISIGIVPLPWSLSGELLPPASKGVGGGICTSINFLAFFLVVKTSPEMFAQFGTAVGFSIYGTLTFLCCIVLYYVLPETRNKTLEEIQKSIL